MSAFSHTLSSNAEILSKGESRAGKLLHPLCLKKVLCKCAFDMWFPASLTILIIILITAHSLGKDSEAPLTLGVRGRQSAPPTWSVAAAAEMFQANRGSAC